MTASKMDCMSQRSRCMFVRFKDFEGQSFGSTMTISRTKLRWRWREAFEGKLEGANLNSSCLSLSLLLA